MNQRIVRVLGAALLAGAAVVFSTSLAFAQEKGGKSAAPQGKVITIGEVTIVGRVQKPIASVDVSKIQAKLTLAELRQPFLDRIEQATLKEPF
ncbi:hypothetical protein [Pendulispora albinea]|uniref:Uncharacterized protein n=1 Tax=Pendulispora albinea TaxID=2741071 RepID=A0ABZ2LJ67_9BACT